MNLQPLFQSLAGSLYKVEGDGPVERLVLTSEQTRAICNDPFVHGMVYTESLKAACTACLKSLEAGDEERAVVFHILRGGLNFGLREALHGAYGWTRHGSAFISSQRACDEKGDWYITENRYEKVYLPKGAHLYFGDVVATGVSLEHALLKLVELAQKQDASIARMTFFTIGGDRAEQILEKVDAKCRELFEDYEGSRVIYIEGVFGVAEADSPLSIALAGTDLLRSPALMAPEFVESQNEDLAYALERCTIYDAGSRAFHLEEYLEDVHEYWGQVKKLAEDGMSYAAYLKERFPEDLRLQNEDWVAKHDSADLLLEVAETQLSKS